ncbi:MAG: hypothetical protein AAGG50_20210 [Bacteroidota bacterium]
MLRFVRYPLFLFALSVMACDSADTTEDPPPAGPAPVCGYIELTGQLAPITIMFGGSKTLDLEPLFSHSKDYMLTYTAAATDEAINVSVNNDIVGVPMRVRSNFEEGTFSVAVTADDFCADSENLTTEFEIEVVPLQ